MRMASLPPGPHLCRCFNVFDDGADAQRCRAGRRHAARHHEAHRGASRLLAAAEKGARASACVKFGVFSLAVAERAF